MIIKHSNFEKSTLIAEKKFFLFYGPNFGKIESCVEALKKKLISLDASLKFLSFFQDDFFEPSFTRVIKMRRNAKIRESGDSVAENTSRMSPLGFHRSIVN